MAVGPLLARLLKQYGLESLTDWASQAVIQGWSENEIMLQMWDRPEFRTRFKGIFLRETRGYTPMSPEEWLSYESSVKATARMWGMELTQAEIEDMGGNYDVSPVEFDARSKLWATAVYDSDQETRDQLERLFGISGGDLFRYWIDPKKELGRLQTQYRMGEIAGAAMRSNYGQITEDQARRLAEAGVTRDDAVGAFGQFSAAAQLFSPIDFGEDLIDQDTQVEAIAGDAGATQAIEQRGQRRKAEFEGGGGFASGEQGFATGTAK